MSFLCEWCGKQHIEIYNEQSTSGASDGPTAAVAATIAEKQKSLQQRVDNGVMEAWYTISAVFVNVAR
ncbi:hypothetical protein Tco_0334146, partial [Tanacetum coccineum]